MKGSFVHPGLDSENDHHNNNNNNNNNNYEEFDLHTDFSQFLEEAKRQANHDMKNSKPQIGQKQVIINEEIKKSKKCWKTVLFSFWKSSSSSSSDKKSSKRHSKDILLSSNVHAATPHTKLRGCVSSPLYDPGYNSETSSGRSRHRVSGSGPLIGLFQPKKREENEMAYVSLNKPEQDAGVYGPLYLVS